MRETELGPPTDDSVPGVLAQAGSSTLVIDYRSLPDDGRLREWLGRPRPHRFVAGFADPDDPSSSYRKHDSLGAFDSLVFVPTVRPTTPF